MHTPHSDSQDQKSPHQTKDEQTPLATFEPTERLGGLRRDDRETPIEDATWYEATSRTDRLAYDLSAGELEDAEYLSFDLLVDGVDSIRFELILYEGGERLGSRLAYQYRGPGSGYLRSLVDVPKFTVRFHTLPKCSARIWVDLHDFNTWIRPRDRGWLKSTLGGDRLTLDRVDRIEIRPFRMPADDVRWCQTPLAAHAERPNLRETQVLPEGPLLDEFGQSRIHEWGNRTRTEAELASRLRHQRRVARERGWPDDYSAWGGLSDQESNHDFDATGYFGVAKEGNRWWFVTPDGQPFWSTGLNTVRFNVDALYEGIEDTHTLDFQNEVKEDHGDGHHDRTGTVNYLRHNFEQVFEDDPREAWREATIGHLKQFGFNTFGFRSDQELASRAEFPYTRQLGFSFDSIDHIHRDFPDVYDDAFETEAKKQAEQLESTVDDPALLGYFLNNEPEWWMGIATNEPLAAGMLYDAKACASREEFAEFLSERHGSVRAASNVWGIEFTRSDIVSHSWTKEFPDEAREDLEAFSGKLLERYFRTLSAACRAVDPNHLNLGSRVISPPPEWAFEGISHFDVLTINSYTNNVPVEAFGRMSEAIDLPVLIGEFGFGALDAGLPAPGLVEVRDQLARGNQFREFLETAAVQPWCVGAHFFRMYDQSMVAGQPGENYNIGFLDVCNRPYGPVSEAARHTHENLYELVTGRREPFENSGDGTEKKWN